MLVSLQSAALVLFHNAQQASVRAKTKKGNTTLYYYMHCQRSELHTYEALALSVSRPMRTYPWMLSLLLLSRTACEAQSHIRCPERLIFASLCFLRLSTRLIHLFQKDQMDLYCGALFYGSKRSATLATWCGAVNLNLSDGCRVSCPPQKNSNGKTWTTF